MLAVTSGRNTGELVLLGSDRPLTLNWNSLDQLFATPARTGDLARAQMPDQGAVAGRILFGGAEIPALTGGAPLNTDDNGLIEFASLANLYSDTKVRNTDRLFESAVDARNYISGVPEDTRSRVLLELSRSAVSLHDFRRGLVYSQALLGYGDSYTSSLAAGDVLYGLRRTPEAIEQWRRALELQPGDAAALLRLVRHYRANWPRDRPPEFRAWAAELAAKRGALVPIPPDFLNTLAQP
jgi:tetratricopeptide (TPR) repeat protein